MIRCLGSLGVEVSVRDDDSLWVKGCGGVLPGRAATLHAGLAGTTSRFVTALAALGTEPYLIDGDEPLRRRPMGPLHDALVALGADVAPHGAARSPAGDDHRAGRGRRAAADAGRRVEPVPLGADDDRPVPAGRAGDPPHDPARLGALPVDDGGGDALVRRRRRVDPQRAGDHRAPAPLRAGDRLRRRARRLVGQLPAGRRRPARRHGEGGRLRPPAAAGRRRLPRDPRRHGLRRAARRRRSAGEPRSESAARSASMSTCATCPISCPTARRRRRHGLARRRRSPASGSSGPRRATGSATSPTSCARPAPVSRSSATGC